MRKWAVQPFRIPLATWAVRVVDSGVDLEQATRLEGGEGRYRIVLSDAWEIWGPNGGYLAAIALRAAGDLANIKRPRSFYCHFLSSPSFEEVQLRVETLKRGRRAESFAVAMSQQGKPVLHALVKTAADARGHEHEPPRSPEVPAAGDLETQEPGGGSRRPRFAFWENIERRPVDRGVEETPPRRCANGRAFGRAPASRTPSSTLPVR